MSLILSIETVILHFETILIIEYVRRRNAEGKHEVLRKFKFCVDSPDGRNSRISPKVRRAQALAYTKRGV